MTTKQKVLRGLKIALLVLLAIVVVAVGSLWFMFRHEIATINTIEQPNAEVPFLTMTYKGDYGFDEFLEVGAANDEALISFITGRLLKGLPVSLNAPDLACSTFTAATPEGERIFGRNFDLSTDSPGMLVYTTPDDGYRSISMINLAFLSYGSENLPTGLTNSILALAAPYVPLDGVNEKGLAMGVLLIATEETHQDTGKVDINTTTAIRMVLDKCASVEEAVEMLSRYDMHSSAGTSYHFQISDASGASVVVEYVENEMVVHQSDIATNFLLTEGDWDFGRGQDRYAILEETLAEKQNVLTEPEGMQLLEAVSQQPKEGAGEGGTYWSVVYNLDKGTAKVCIRMDYDTVYEYALAA